ncbi:MAG: phosphatase PAP2 family protein [Planctomycetes bacterium]|nr:phosphatase PAP2 family protein [Planctomycetota bacterium]
MERRAPRQVDGAAAAAEGALARRELALLLGAALVVAGLLGFILLAGIVNADAVQRLDEQAVLALRHPDDPGRLLGPAWLSDAARDVTALGSTVVLVIFTLVAAGWLGLRRSWPEAGLLGLALAGGSALTWSLKGLFERARPDLVPHLDAVMSPSFPSGHALQAAVVYLTLGAVLARLLPRRSEKLYALAVALGLALLVGVSRVVVGVHYPTDVLAGWCVGAAWASLCWFAALRLQRRGDDVSAPAP